jgi:hypothetical protein
VDPDRSASLRLLAAQREQWESHQADPDNSRHTCGCVVELTGEVDRMLLDRALAATLAEAEALRTTFHVEDRMPRQTVGPVPENPLAYRDLTGRRLPRAAARAWLDAELARPIDLRAGEPAAEHTLLRLGARRYALFLRYHHIALDVHGAHRHLLRLAEHYAALRAGRTPEPGEFAALADLVGRERDYLASGEAAQARRFWRTALADLPAQRGLSDRDVPAGPHPLRVTAPIPEESWGATGELAAALSRHWSAVLLAAVADYLHGYTGADDLVLGLVAANRDTEPALRTPAQLAVDLPVRVIMPATGSFADLVRAVSRSAGEALRHQGTRPDPFLPADFRPLRTVVEVLTEDDQPRFGGCLARLRMPATGPVADLRITVHAPSGQRQGAFLDLQANPGRYSPAELRDHQEGLLDRLNELLRCPAPPAEPDEHFGEYPENWQKQVQTSS